MSTRTLFHFPGEAMLAGPLSIWLAPLRRAVLCAVSVLFGLLLSACTEFVNLQTGLNDSDANEIVSLLHRQGMEAQKQQMKEGITVKVKSTDISRATEAMQKAGLPRRQLADLGRVFKKEGMISTPMEERIRYIHGMSQELESTLQQIDNVVTARVHVVLPERVAPGEPIMPSSAAVFIKHHLPFNEDLMLPRIRNLVASSIPGLSGEHQDEKVTIVLTPAVDLGPGLQWEMVGPFKVDAESATSLQVTLIIMSSLIGLQIFSLICGFLMRFSAIANMMAAAAGGLRKVVASLTRFLSANKRA